MNVAVIPTGGDETHEIAIDAHNMIIFWDPDDHHRYVGSGGNADSCTPLYHEFFHAYEHAKGTHDRSPCVTEAGPSGLPTNEVNATRAQNRLLHNLGLPERDHYGATPLPEGECLPPDRQPKHPVCSGGGGCGNSHGDPHLSTFDRRHYSFQAVGEFVLARDPAGGFEVQARQVPAVAAPRRASLNGAVAMDVAGTRVEARAEEKGLVLLVAGAQRPLAATELPGGGTVRPSPGVYGDMLTVRWPDGSVVAAEWIRAANMFLMVQPAPARKGHLEGLLGDFDGNPDDDIRPRGGGRPIGDPTYDALYPAFADSWRVDQRSSLFTYAAGTGPATYADRSLPDRAASSADLPNRAAAEALCRQFGVTEPAALTDCTFDVAVTGRPDFAASALASQTFAGTLVPGGRPVAAAITAPGGVARFSFAGTAGQVVSVHGSGSTLPDDCAVLQLLDPAGVQIGSGCLIGGSGDVPPTRLEKTGRYTIAVDPTGPATGTVDVRLGAVDQRPVELTADGPAVTARIANPGDVARLGFTGTAGQVVVIHVNRSALPDACGHPLLLDAAGDRIDSGCVIDGVGDLGPVRLPKSGRYTVVVDPGGDATGTADLYLRTVPDQQAEVRVGGPAVTARVAVPGAVAKITFTAAAGQAVQVRIEGSTLPDACGFPVLVAPNGDRIDSGCVINGKGGIDRVTLPAAGRYTLVVDPGRDATGTLRLQVTG